MNTKHCTLTFILFVVFGSVLGGCQNQLSEGRKETALAVFESRAVWRGLPRQFLETLAEKLNSVETASSFAVLCEESGILENNILTLSQYEPQFALFTIAVTLTSYANTMGEQGELMKAKEGLEFALIMEPNYVPSWLSMAIVSGALGDCKAAISWADKCITFEPDPDSESELGAVLAEVPESMDTMRNQAQAIKDICNQ